MAKSKRRCLRRAKRVIKGKRKCLHFAGQKRKATRRKRRHRTRPNRSTISNPKYGVRTESFTSKVKRLPLVAKAGLAVGAIYGAMRLVGAPTQG